jgi:hypothetical protein
MPDIIIPKKSIPTLANIPDFRTRQEIITAIQGIYDYYDYRLKNDLSALETRLLKTNITDFAGGSLISDLGRRLIGSTTTDPLVETIGSGTGNLTTVTITLPAYMTGGGTDNTDPVTFNLGFANQSPLLFFASPTVGVGAVGFRGITHGDIATLDLQRTSTAADPILADLPNAGNASIHKNTTSGNVFLAYNDGGTIKKVQLL